MTPRYAWYSDEMPDAKADAIVRGIRRWLMYHSDKNITNIVMEQHAESRRYIYNGDEYTLMDMLNREYTTVKRLWFAMDAGVWLAGDIGCPGAYFYEDWVDIWIYLVEEAVQQL